MDVKKGTITTLMVLSLGTMGACSKKKEASSASESATDYKILTVTGSVKNSTATSLSESSETSIRPFATGVLYRTGTVSSTAKAYYAFQDGQQFISQGKQGDMMACIVKSLVGNHVIASDGSPSYFKMDVSMVMKMDATVDKTSNSITSYNMYSCNSGSQDQYIGSATSGTAATMTFKVNNSTVKVGMSISGTVDSGGWSSKSVSQYISISDFIAKSTITQNPASIESLSSFSFSSGATSTSIQQNSVSTLYGNSEATYALGQGTVKQKVTQGTATPTENTYSWDDSGTDASDSSHSAEISSASYPTVPTNSDILAAAAFSTGQTWDCQLGAAIVDLSALPPAAQTAIQACMPAGSSGGPSSGP